MNTSLLAIFVDNHWLLYIGSGGSQERLSAEEFYNNLPTHILLAIGTICRISLHRLLKMRRLRRDFLNSSAGPYFALTARRKRNG